VPVGRPLDRDPGHSCRVLAHTGVFKPSRGAESDMSRARHGTEVEPTFHRRAVRTCPVPGTVTEVQPSREGRKRRARTVPTARGRQRGRACRADANGHAGKAGVASERHRKRRRGRRAL